MELIILIHDYVILFVSRIIFLVIYVMLFLFISKNFDFNFYENHQLELVWTVSPFLIILFIIFPSLNSLYLLDSCIFCGFPIFVVGHQWYWRYSSTDLDFRFDSFMIPREVSQIYLLESDNSLVLPCLTPIRCFLTSSDVIHSWTIPSLGIKIDAIPGRLNNFCFSIIRPGLFFGQCSEICGLNHSFIPINLESVSPNNFFSNYSNILCKVGIF